MEAEEAALTAELPATLVFADQEVIGMCGPEIRGQRLIEEGFADEINIEFRALRDRFKTPITAPFSNQIFTHKESGIRYRIKTVQRDYPAQLSFILPCVCLTS